MAHGAFSLSDLDDAPKRQGAFTVDDLESPAPPSVKSPAEQKFESAVQKTAISSIPRPAFMGGQPRPVDVLPGPFGFEDDEGGIVPVTKHAEPPPVKRSVLDYAKAVANITPLQSETPLFPGVGAEIGAAQKLATPGQRVQGATEAVQGVGELASPFIGPAAIESAGAVGPAVKLATGLVTGIGAQEAGGRIAKAAGAKPETQELVKELSFWAPTIAGLISSQVHGGVESTPESTRGAVTGFGGRVGAGVAVTPEGVTLRGKVGPFEGSKTFGRGPAPTSIEPPTIEADPATEALVNAQRVDSAADRMSKGLTPTPAPPPPPKVSESPLAPDSVKQGHISPEDVQKFASAVATLPPDVRAAAIRESHATLAQVLLEQGQNGPVVLPNGQLALVHDQASAEKAALGIINSAVKDHDQALATAGEAKGEKGATVVSPPAAAPTKAGPSRLRAQELAKPQTGKFSVDDLTEGVDLGNDATQDGRILRPHPAPTGERLRPEAGAGRASQQQAGSSPGVLQPDGSKIERVGQTASGGVGVGEHAKPLAKGDSVTLAKDINEKGKLLKSGTRATINYVHPNKLLVRAVTEDGTKISRGMASFAAEKPKSVGSKREDNVQEAAKVGQQTGQPETQSNNANLGRPADSGAVEVRRANSEHAGTDGQESRAAASLSAKSESAPKYKFGNTQANIPNESEAAKSLEAARGRISTSDLAGKGKDIGDGGNHVTVRYGIKGDDTEGIKKFLSQQAHFEASLGKTEKFPPSEHSDGAAVINAPIEAPELHRLNAELEKHGEFTEPSFKEYKPHATVAYVKPEAADRYVGMDVTHGKKFTINQVAISKKDGSQEIVKLEGKTAEPTTGKFKPSDLEAPYGPPKTDFAKEHGGKVPDESLGFNSHPAEDLGNKARAEVERRMGGALPRDQVEQRGAVVPGKVGEMKVSDLKVAPHKFQYKLSTDSEGVGSLLKETKVFNPDLAGMISVWRDPADGKTYVVNGHHRFELAKRLGQKALTVRHIVAKDATEARAIGALQNIAEGRGTAIDAAKFFRDSGLTPEHLKEKGISLGEKTASDGMAMSRLDPSIFQKVVSGDLRQGRAIAIGESTADPAEQKAILSLVEKKERSGTKVSDGTLSELIRLVKGSQQTTETTTDLFGTQAISRSLALEKAEISDYIKQQLAKDKKLFGFVAKGDRATELERGGNKIDVEKSKEISTGAAQAEEVYNKLSARGGSIASILDEAAKQLADGDHAVSVKSEAYARIRAEVSKTLQGSEGSSAGRSEGTPKAGEANQSKDSVGLFSEGQPLFKPATGPIDVSLARQMRVEVVPPTEGMPGYLKVNGATTNAITRIVGVDFLGVNFGPHDVADVVSKLHDGADRLERTGHKDGAKSLRYLANVMLANNDPDSGLNIIRETGNVKQQLKTLHEEALHSVMQRKPGKGTLAVPWKELISEPGMAVMAGERIVPHLKAVGIDPHPLIIVAEGMVDIMLGDAEELTFPEAHRTATKYFEALADTHGIQPIQDALSVEKYIAGLENEYGLAHNRDQYAIRQAGVAAATDVLQRRSGKGTAPRGSNVQTGTDVAKPERSSPPGTAPDRLRSDEIERGNATPPGTSPLHSTQPVGLSDEELDTWSKSKGFRVEPAGEQLGMFGSSEPVMRVFRSGPRGHEQKGLVYQSQLEKLKEAKPESNEPFALTGGEARDEAQSGLFGPGDLGEIIGNPHAEGIKMPPRSNGGESLFRGERGEFEPGKVGKAATDATGAVGEYLRDVAKNTHIARDLQRGLETLDTQKQADILRGVKTMKELALPHADDEAIYNHLENPDEESLTPKQDDILEKSILPLQDANAELYTELTKGGIPIENYVHRVVKGKGGALDKIARGLKSFGRGSSLSKSAPQTKQRTYMALEKTPSEGNLTRPSEPGGERVVVSIKGGQVTAWRNGEAENLGGISHTQEGNVFEDKDGNIWNLKQATTKEIEANTETRYYHSALASTIASNIQLNSAVRAMRFLEAFKQSPEFKETAFQLGGKGNPPEGWKTTNLPQFAGYAFEPRTAEVLDWQYDRMRQGNIGALEQVGKLMRISMLLNPIKHPVNVAASWAMEKGATGLFMSPFHRAAWKSGNKAIKAVLSKNQDFLDALDAGAPLQSHQDAIRDIHKLFFDQLGEGLDNNEPWALKAMKALGIEHGNLLNLLKLWPKLTHQVAFSSGDILFLQSAYQYQMEHPGVSLADALKESGRINPEYRVPTRIFDSHLFSKIMTNKWTTIFGPYHYSLMKSFAEVGKSALGAQPPTAGRTKADEVAKGWDRIALIALGMVAMTAIGDELAKKLTGDKHARIRRAGPFGIVDSAIQVAEHKQSVSTALQRVVTPAPQTKAAAELAFNREFYAGHQIYDPHADWKTQTEQIGHYLLGELGMVGQVEKAQTTEQKHRLAWQQVEIQMAKTRAEKTAADIAMSKVGTQAESPDDQEHRVGRREILDQLRKGNSKPLDEAQAKHELTHKQVENLRHRARLTPLEDTVHGFSLAEVRKVYDAAKADNNQEEMKMLERVKRQKFLRLMSEGRGGEARAASQ